MSDTAKPGTAGQVREQVKVLGERFLQRTADQVVTFREQLRQFSTGDTSVLLPIQEVAHKIHGSGAMFGFARISESAGDLEGLSAQIAREITAAGTAAHVEYARRLAASVEQVAEALAAARQPRFTPPRAPGTGSC